MGVCNGGQGGAVLPWIFIHGRLTGKAEKDLMVLFFGLVFFPLAPLKIFLPTPLELGIITNDHVKKIR